MQESKAMNMESTEPDAIESSYKAAPGTEVLYDTAEDRFGTSRLHHLQHVKSGDGHLLLVPQPSLTDPNDPLRWSITKKWCTFSFALAYAFMGAVTGPIMTGCKSLHRCLLLTRSPLTNLDRDGRGCSFL